MPRETQSRDEQKLWERYARSLPIGPATCPPAIELAAWIDGRAADSGAEAVEMHLAACSVCRAAVAAIRLRPAVREPRLRFADWLAPSLAPGRWGLAAAASIAMCFAGYSIGAGRTTLDAVTTDEILLREMSFGLLNGSDEGLLVVLDGVAR